MAQDSIHVHNFHGHVKAREKMLFLEIIIVLWCLLTVETKISWFLVQGLDNATRTAEARYPINFTKSGKQFVLSLHYNGNNSFFICSGSKNVSI